jgi:hypothetical protein
VSGQSGSGRSASLGASEDEPEPEDEEERLRCEAREIVASPCPGPLEVDSLHSPMSLGYLFI